MEIKIGFYGRLETKFLGSCTVVHVVSIPFLIAP